jgi:DnaJ like chaperone protein
MQYWGKIIGVAFAIIMGAGFWGIVLGSLSAICLIRRAAAKWPGLPISASASHSFSTTFEVMGHLTKSKGASRKPIFRLPASLWIA